MPTCVVLIERGGDASLDIVSEDYTEATKSAFRRLVDSNANDIKGYLQNGRSNERAYNFSATDMELSLTSVVLATSLDRSGIDFVVYDDENIIDKYKCIIDHFSGDSYGETNTSDYYVNDYIWLDNFRLQSARKTGMLGMMEINRWHTWNKQFGRSRYEYCCLPSWCGGWDGDWCEDCYCEDNHSLFDNSWEISFMDDSKICGLTQGNPSIYNLNDTCSEALDDDGVTVLNDGEVHSISSTALGHFKEAHRKNVGVQNPRVKFL